MQLRCLKHKLSACILILTLAATVLCSYPATVGIKLHALGLCFISAACFSANAEILIFSYTCLYIFSS